MIDAATKRLFICEFYQVSLKGTKLLEIALKKLYDEEVFIGMDQVKY